MPALEHFFDDDDEEVQSSEEDTSSESSEAGESSDFSEEVDAVDKKPLIDCDCKETLSPDMRNFVVVDGRCPHWGDSPYQPPSKLQHLMNELEKEGDEVSETEAFYPRTPARRRKSLQQRLYERTTRKKRMAMAKEAYSYQESLKSQKSRSTSKSQATTPTPSARRALLKKQLPTPPCSPAARGTSDRGEARRRALPNTSMEARSGEVSFTAPKIQSSDTMSQRSGGSDMIRKEILDGLEWESE